MGFAFLFNCGLLNRKEIKTNRQLGPVVNKTKTVYYKVRRQKNRKRPGSESDSDGRDPEWKLRPTLGLHLLSNFGFLGGQGLQAFSFLCFPISSPLPLGSRTRRCGDSQKRVCDHLTCSSLQARKLQPPGVKPKICYTKDWDVGLSSFFVSP